MSAPAAPPAWVMALPLDPGAWRVLVGLWSYADYGATGDQLVGPSRPRLAARIGIKPRACRAQLAALKGLGLISEGPRGTRFGELALVLHWREAAQVRRKAAQPCLGTPRPPSGTPMPSKRHTCAVKAAQVDTQALQDLAIDLVDLAEEGSADDATPVPMDLDTRIKATSPAAAMANANGHPSNPKSWPGIMAEAVLDLSLDDDAVIRVLVAWEAAPRESKPSMTQLWWRCSRPWVAEALGVKPIERKRSGKAWDLTDGATYTPPAAGGAP